MCYRILYTMGILDLGKYRGGWRMRRLLSSLENIWPHWTSKSWLNSVVDLDLDKDWSVPLSKLKLSALLTLSVGKDTNFCKWKIPLSALVLLLLKILSGFSTTFGGFRSRNHIVWILLGSIFFPSGVTFQLDLLVESPGQNATLLSLPFYLSSKGRFRLVVLLRSI